MASVSEELELEIGSALAALGELDTRFQEAAATFGDSIAQAVESAGISESVASQIEAADISSLLSAQIEEGIAAAETGIPVSVDEVDTSILISEVEEGIASADTSVAIEEPDASAITDAIEGAIGDVDSSALDELGASAAGAAGGLQDIGTAGEAAGSGLEKTASSATITAGGLAAIGKTSDAVTGKVGALVSKFGPVGAGLAAVAVSGKVLFTAASEAEQALGRFDTSLGEAAASVRLIDIGGLNADLSELAIQTGSVDEGLFRAAAGIADLGRSSGASQAAIATTAEQILALSLRSAALRPELGTADEVIGSLTRGLARGGRTIQAFGIDLSAADIKARALSDTGKAAAAELSQFELAAAGAAIATERLGDQLGEDVTRGSQSAVVQARSLKAAFGELVEVLGAPILDSVSDTIGLIRDALSGLIPVASKAAEGFDWLNRNTLNLGEAVSAIAITVQLARTGFDDLSVLTREQLELLAELPGPQREAAAAALEHKDAIDLQAAAAANFGEGFSELEVLFGEKAQAVAEHILLFTEAFQQNLPTSSALLGQFADSIVENFDKGVGALSDMLKAQLSFFDNIQAIIDKGGQDTALAILALGPVEGAAFAQATAQAGAEQLAALESVTDQQNLFLGGAGGRAGTIYGNAIAAGANTTIPGIAAKGTELGGAAISGVNAQLPGAEGAGANLGGSIAAGLEKSKPHVFVRVRSWGLSVRRALEDIFEFGSPSKVGLRIGAGLAESVALGIESGIPRVETAIARIRPALVSVGAGAVGNSTTNHNSFVINDRTGDPFVTAELTSREIARQAM